VVLRARRNLDVHGHALQAAYRDRLWGCYGKQRILGQPCSEVADGCTDFARLLAAGIGGSRVAKEEEGVAWVGDRQELKDPTLVG